MRDAHHRRRPRKPRAGCKREDRNVLPFVFRRRSCALPIAGRLVHAASHALVRAVRQVLSRLVLSGRDRLTQSSPSPNLASRCSMCRWSSSRPSPCSCSCMSLRMFVLTDEQDVEFLLTFAFIPARYGTDLGRQRRISRRLRRRSVDLLHLRFHPRRSHASRPQSRLADAVRHRAGAPLRARGAISSSCW